MVVLGVVVLEVAVLEVVAVLEDLPHRNDGSANKDCYLVDGGCVERAALGRVINEKAWIYAN
jgi:hypothetical protein